MVKTELRDRNDRLITIRRHHIAKSITRSKAAGPQESAAAFR
jgi:hypothetical protein